MRQAAESALPTDALALRALAHPVRWKLIDVLAGEGTATAKRCSELTGESTGTCSYHLGILAKYGYIKRVASQEWREKPWRLTSPDIDVSSAGLDEEGAAASRAAAAALVDYTMTRLKESLLRNVAEPAEWRQVSKVLATTAWLTAAESRQAAAEMKAVLDRYGGHDQGQPDRPPQGRLVHLVVAIALDGQNHQSDEQ